MRAEAASLQAREAQVVAHHVPGPGDIAHELIHDLALLSAQCAARFVGENRGVEQEGADRIVQLVRDEIEQLPVVAIGRLQLEVLARQPRLALPDRVHHGPEGAGQAIDLEPAIGRRDPEIELPASHSLSRLGQGAEGAGDAAGHQPGAPQQQPQRRDREEKQDRQGTVAHVQIFALENPHVEDPDRPSSGIANRLVSREVPGVDHQGAVQPGPTLHEHLAPHDLGDSRAHGDLPVRTDDGRCDARVPAEDRHRAEGFVAVGCTAKKTRPEARDDLFIPVEHLQRHDRTPAIGG